jgi:hypothetical protein
MSCCESPVPETVINVSLAELAIANAAFEVIRTAVSNGKEVWELGDHLSKFSDAGREIDQQQLI